MKLATVIFCLALITLASSVFAEVELNLEVLDPHGSYRPPPVYKGEDTDTSEQSGAELEFPKPLPLEFESLPVLKPEPVDQDILDIRLRDATLPPLPAPKPSVVYDRNTLSGASELMSQAFDTENLTVIDPSISKSKKDPEKQQDQKNVPVPEEPDLVPLDEDVSLTDLNAMDVLNKLGGAPANVPKATSKALPAAGPNEYRIFFATGQARIPEDQKKPLFDFVSQTLRKSPAARIRIVAYAAPTDEKKSASDLKRIALDRAIAIQDMLVNKGVEFQKIDLLPKGHADPDLPLDYAAIIMTNPP